MRKKMNVKRRSFIIFLLMCLFLSEMKVITLANDQSNFIHEQLEEEILYEDDADSSDVIEEDVEVAVIEQDQKPDEDEQNNVVVDNVIAESGTEEADAIEPTATGAYIETLEVEDEIVLQLERSGSVRVIVELDESFTPEGRLSIRNREAQKNKIKAAQEEVLETISEVSADSVIESTTFETIPYLALEVDAEGLQLLSEHDKVKSITEDIAVYTSDLVEVNDEELRTSPQLYQTNSVMNTDKAWSRGLTGQGKTVAILDTGVDKNHPFLANKVVSEACYSSTGHCPGGATELTTPGSAVDYNGHGTHVAGIATGKGSHFSGVAKDANIIAINVLANDGNGQFSDVIKGLERVFALRNQYDITAVNLSLGGGRFTSACDQSFSSMKNMVDNLRSVGIATIAASGNEFYKNALSAPACISSVISVGATNNNDAVTSFSNSALFLDLLAPGHLVYSSVPGGGFNSNSGTSMASPQVAGGITLVKQLYPDAAIDELVSYMKQNGVYVTDTANGITKPRLDFSWMEEVLPELDQVQQPTWNGDVIRWTGVPNGIEYELNLYKNSQVVDTRRVGATVRQHNYHSNMGEPGVYTVTVQAIGDQINYGDGIVSIPSTENKKGVLYFESFESNNGGYTVTGINASWQWGVPNTGPSGAFSGSSVWGTNLNGNYRNNENSFIVSPPIDLSDATSPITLSWMQYAVTERNWDYINVDISNDDGQTWSRIYRDHGVINTSWAKKEFEIDPTYAVSHFRVRFGIQADIVINMEGFYIDDVMLTGVALPALGQVQKPTWNGDVIHWYGVSQATQYEVKLYRGETEITTQRVGASVRQFNFASHMTSPGGYTATVQGIGDQTNYRNGEVSVPSEENRKIIALPVVQKPTWSGDVIHWTGVANAHQYELKLYRGTSVVTTQRVGSTVRQHNFASQMASPGGYTVTVQAIGDQTNYSHGGVSVPSEENRKIIALPVVQKPTWSGDVIHWTGVANAHQYELKLYRGTSVVTTQRVGSTVRQHNFASQMESPGKYTVTVQAIGDQTSYSDGEVSEPSNENQIFVTLSTVQKPTWNGDVIRWNSVANASNYELKLYRGTTLVRTQRVNGSVNEFNFASRMGNPGAYRVTVQALGDEMNYLDGPVSARSNQKVTLNQVQKPTWSGDVIRWNSVANASNYELKLYRGTTLVRTQRVRGTVTQYNFGSRMESPGSYRVTVQALGNNGTYRNGPVSTRSNQKVTLNRVTKPTWNGDVIRWNGVANASQYELKLYRGSTLVRTERVRGTVRQYNFASRMGNAGTYRVTVQAIGNNGTYRNGPVSLRSNQKVTLSKVAKPTWNGDVVRWNSVANASQYELKLYRGNTLVRTERVRSNVRQFNFSSRMKSRGSYTVTVQAIGNNQTYRNGAVSTRSNVRKK